MLAFSITSSLRPSLAGRVRLHRDTTCSSARHSDHRGDEAGPTRREALKATLASLALMAAGPQAALAEGGAREGEVRHTDAEWRQLLTPAQYRVLRQAATESRYSSPLVEEHRRGTFACAGCAAPLFPSEAKFESGTGWPSFFDALPGAVVLQQDNSIPFMSRTEVRCARCAGHLGHVFDDGPQPTGLRYCMNGAALVFKPLSA